MSKRKILALALTLSMAAILAIGGSLAYFTDGDEKTNTFTVGNVDIALTEPKWPETNPQVYPGQVLDKDPTVKNTGANPCYVRIMVTGLDCLKNVGAGEISYITDGDTGKLGNDWEEYEGYYYYTDILKPEDTTNALFDQIKIPTDLKNGDGETEFNVIVTAEAVQSQGAGDLETAKDIAEWFVACGL